MAAAAILGAAKQRSRLPMKMKSGNDLKELFAREAELEKAMRQPGGARIIEEQELLAVRKKLANRATALRETAESERGIGG
ncbi:MAG TPA: hypothetical protein VN815_14820 [Steroidobacteraceae bacterium]|jgi:hypothetical protein|nr:hypothetical protein [Steroidobacteraceae bacterium]